MSPWLGLVLYLLNSLGWLALGYLLGRLARGTHRRPKRRK